ncbi:hypothetical protein GDO81_008167 [Engystomops pustulosus]|uniref:A-kinase anchor protein 7-like phosphoesterase domain-containing protein n=1 Tax=Engystomops pustulosus TaxID=76066 RepID=A0AAV7CCL4_ENGPU|nr:hypothetical protein GDO81_008167 [Engystomops pustulosus]
MEAHLLTWSCRDPAARSPSRIWVFRRFTKVVRPMSTKCRCCTEVRLSSAEFTILFWVQVSACQATHFLNKYNGFSESVRSSDGHAPDFRRMHAGAGAPASPTRFAVGSGEDQVSATTNPTEKKVKKKRKPHKSEIDENGDKSNKCTRPNYFVSLPITNVKVLDNIQTLQNSVLEKDDRFSRAMIPQGSFHLTLFVMHLGNEKEVTLATSALLDSKKPIEEIIQGNVLLLSFCGISDFKHEVAYVNMTNEASVAALKQISAVTGKIFMEKGISVTGCKDFVPHLTFMKLSRAPKLRKEGIKKIDASLYKDFQVHWFGDDSLTRLDLCSMLKKKQPSGYYHTDASISFVLQVHGYTCKPTRT